MTQRKQTAWVITDGRRGIVNQALGLAEACAEIRPFEFNELTLTSSALFGKLPPYAQAALRPRLSDFGLAGPKPDILIGCGRQAIAPLLAARRQYPNMFTVYIQDPRLKPSEFGMVIAPRHDELVGDTVFSIIGSPNRVTPKRLKAAAKDIPIKPTKGRRLAAWLVGGNSKSHKLTASTMAHHESLAKAVMNQGYDLYITTSRRTPETASQRYADMASQMPGVRVYDSARMPNAPNPYYALLAQADIICVTEDSTNMLTESCASGRPVFRLQMEGNPRKFQKLYDELSDRCHVERFEGQITPSKPYKPLMETQRAAAAMWERIDGLRA